MAIQYLIGGADVTQYVDLPSVNIQANITTNNDVASFSLTKVPNTITRPKGGQEFKIINGGLNEFAGVMAGAMETVPDGLPNMNYACQSKDYSFWFNKHVVTNTYPNWELSAIVKDIVSTFANASGAGFTVNHMYSTGVYVTQKYDHIEPTQAIQALADSVGFWFYIDYDKDVHFSPILTDISPLPNNALLVDTDLANYSNLTFTEDISQVRNQAYLYGYKLPLQNAITEQFVGNGYNTTFVMTYEMIHSLTGNLVYLNGVQRTCALDIAGGLPPATGTSPVDDGKVYLNYAAQTLRFLAPPAAGIVGSNTYKPMIGTASLYTNPTSIAIMKARDGLDGIYEFGENNANLSSVDTSLANLEGAKQLLKYGLPHYIGEFDSYMQGWKPGQYFFLTSDMRMGGEFQNRLFYVLKVTKTVVNNLQGGSPFFAYHVSVADSPYSF